jgi:hypothetical protein
VHSLFRLHAHKALGGLLLAAAFLSGCHNNNQNSGIGIGWTSLTADTDPQFSSYQVMIDSVILEGKVDGPVTVIATPELVDLTKLDNISELWAGASIPVDTYTAAVITLDYTSAQIAVMVNGVPQFVKVQDTTGAAVTQISVEVLLDPSNQLTLIDTLAATDAHRLAFSFDLTASSQLDFTTTPATLTIRPFVSFSTRAADSKLVRVRGPLINSSLNQGTYTVSTRPFLDEVDNLGVLTVFNSPSTVFSIAGATVVGTPGLTTLSTSSAGSTMTAAYTVFEPTTVPQAGVIAGKFNAQYVVAGGTLEDFFTDGLEGDVIARSGNTLTLRGATLAQTSFQTVTYLLTDTTVLLGPGTLVTADGVPGLTLNPAAVSVGQHVVVRGLYSVDSAGVVHFDASGTSSTDTGSVRLVSQLTEVSGPVVSTGSGTATLSLAAINGWPTSIYNFAGTASASGQNSNPAAFVVNTNGLTLPNGPAGSPVAAGDFLAVNGFSGPFGSTPPDFRASVINAEPSAPATIAVTWSTGDNAPFATAAATGLSLNLTNAGLISASILVGGETIDMTTLPASPQIVPATPANDPTSGLPVFAPLFCIGNNLINIQCFNTLTPFENQASTFFTTAPAVRFLAHGFYNRGTNTFTASRINVVL